MKRHGYAPLLFKDAKTLYSLYYDWLNEWVKQPAQLADPTACTLARQRHHELLLFLHDRLITTLMPKPVVSKTEEAWLKAPTLH
jgi:hypothetical protein